MVSPFRFAIISDPHVTLPHTQYAYPSQFHFVEASVPALEQVLATLAAEPLDFLLMPGDLTQHGERDNHHWLTQRLSQLPFPAYVVPGNHDVITANGDEKTVSMSEFTDLYGPFGYSQQQPYYHQELVPGVHLVGLNSIALMSKGSSCLRAHVDAAQLQWLAETLQDLQGEWVIAMVHHNVLEHMPGQATHPMGQRYIIQNRQALIDCLQAHQVRLVLTGHLHVQDVLESGDLWAVTTGSLVSYPHPYRRVAVASTEAGALQMQITTERVQALPDWPDLQTISRQRMGDRSGQFMSRFLSCPPLSLPSRQAVALAPIIRDFWAAIAAGDSVIDYPQLPEPVRRYLHSFGAMDAEGRYRAIDNQATLTLAARSALKKGSL
ncbi:MAG: metallophosphoesterase [Leptolyngbya sp. RL_3_1]|nr:metallophosphoesterase [Leptolyngbya sp. RL_3_1]